MEMGISTEEVKSSWPHALLLPRQPAEETIAWQGVIRQLYDITPRIEPVRSGQAYFRPEAHAPLHALAERLGVRIGLSTRRSHALLTALRTDAGAVSNTPHDQLTAFYQNYPTGALTRAGFDEEMTHRLQQFGLHTLANVAQLTRRHLTAQFGDEGTRLHALLHPPSDPAPLSLYEPPETLSQTYDVEHPFSPGNELASALGHMLDGLSEELDERQCQHVLLRADAAPEQPPMSRLLREPIPHGQALRRHARRLLDELIQQKPHRIDSITLELGSLSHPTRSQGHLFARKPPLQQALKAVDERFPDMLLRVEFDRHALFEEDAVSFVSISA